MKNSSFENKIRLIKKIRKDVESLSANRIGVLMGIKRNSAYTIINPLYRNGIITKERIATEFPGRPKIMYKYNFKRFDDWKNSILQYFGERFPGDFNYKVKRGKIRIEFNPNNYLIEFRINPKTFLKEISIYSNGKKAVEFREYLGPDLYNKYSYKYEFLEIIDLYNVINETIVRNGSIYVKFNFDYIYYEIMEEFE